MTGARGEYPRPDMTRAAGAMTPACLCNVTCGDYPEEMDPLGVCKSLPRKPESPLVEIVLVDRRDAGVTFWDRIAQSHRRLGRRGR